MSKGLDERFCLSGQLASSQVLSITISNSYIQTSVLNVNTSGPFPELRKVQEEQSANAGGIPGTYPAKFQVEGAKQGKRWSNLAKDATRHPCLAIWPWE